MVWAMRIFWSIRIGMMHSVQNSVGSRRQVRTSLPNPGKEVKKLFPEFAHHKHLMSGVSMKKEALAEQGEVPVQQKEDYYNHLLIGLFSTNINFSKELSLKFHHWLKFLYADFYQLICSVFFRHQ